MANGNLEKRVLATKDPEPLAEQREELGPDYVIFDPVNPNALINQVPESLRDVMLTLNDNQRYLSEAQLKRACHDERHARLRVAFWLEYNNAQRSQRKMSISNAIRGVCTQDYWENVILTDPDKVAYVIVPPKDYLVTMTELLDLGLDRMREIIKAPLFDSRGRFDSKTADKVIKAVHSIEARLKGAVVQKTMNLNADLSAPGIEAVNTNTSNLEELEAQVARVRAKLDRAEDKKYEGQVIDAIEGELVGETKEDSSE